MMNKPTGFTLIETLVAITVLTLAVIAPFAAIQRVMHAAYASKNEITASALAQEGIEYVRFVRDNNFLANQADFVSASHQLDGMNGTNGPDCRGNNKCIIDATVDPSSSSAVQLCPNGGCPPLYTDNTNGFYTQQSGSGKTATIYTRSVSVSQQAGYQTVTVTMSWEDRGPHTIVLKDTLYDWL